MPATHDDETAYFDDDDVTPELDSLAPSTTRPFGAIALESTQSVPSDSSESPAVGSKAYRNRRAKERARIRKQNQRNAEQ